MRYLVCVLFALVLCCSYDCVVASETEMRTRTLESEIHEIYFQLASHSSQTRESPQQIAMMAKEKLKEALSSSQRDLHKANKALQRAINAQKAIDYALIDIQQLPGILTEYTNDIHKVIDKVAFAVRAAVSGQYFTKQMTDFIRSLEGKTMKYISYVTHYPKDADKYAQLALSESMNAISKAKTASRQAELAELAAKRAEALQEIAENAKKGAEREVMQAIEGKMSRSSATNFTITFQSNTNKSGMGATGQGITKGLTREDNLLNSSETTEQIERMREQEKENKSLTARQDEKGAAAGGKENGNKVSETSVEKNAKTENFVQKKISVEENKKKDSKDFNTKDGIDINIGLYTQKQLLPLLIFLFLFFFAY